MADTPAKQASAAFPRNTCWRCGAAIDDHGLQRLWLFAICPELRVGDCVDGRGRRKRPREDWLDLVQEDSPQ